MNTYNKGFAFIALIWIVAALVVVSGGVYYASKHAAKVEMKGNEGTTTAQMQATTSAQVSLKDLFGKKVKCAFSTLQNGTQSDGTAYINGENLRVDAVSKQGDKLVAESHMIKTGTDVYVWSSMGAGAGYGAKLKLDATTEAQTKEKLAVDLDKKLNYKCDDWSPEQAKFVAPTTINFFDLGSKVDVTSKISSYLK